MLGCLACARVFWGRASVSAPVDAAFAVVFSPEALITTAPIFRVRAQFGGLSCVSLFLRFCSRCRFFARGPRRSHSILSGTRSAEPGKSSARYPSSETTSTGGGSDKSDHYECVSYLRASKVVITFSSLRRSCQGLGIECLYPAYCVLGGEHRRETIAPDHWQLWGFGYFIVSGPV